MPINKFRPGQVWCDTEGRPIQAHGGGVTFHEGIYYWYGENKTGCSARDRKLPWHAGVNCYSSRDLFNWKHEGVVLPARPDDPAHDLHPLNIMDRPHVIFNDRTGRFVMWMKIVRGGWGGAQSTGIAVADSPTGPFEYLRSFLPCGMASGDANFFMEPAPEKKYYWVFNRPHTSVVIADLTDDTLDVTGMYSLHFPHAGPPAAREAPVVVKRNERYYLISSGTTGYAPNPSEWAEADLIHGPWRVHGNPCVGPKAETSFDAQFASAFEVVGRPNCFIGIADRWTPDDIADSRYVWLPLLFEDGRLSIRWFDEWDLSVFDAP